MNNALSQSLNMSREELLEYFKINNIMTGGFQIQWSNKYLGFGSVYTYSLSDETLHIDNECMSKECIRAILYKAVDYMIDNAVFDDDFLQEDK